MASYVPVLVVIQKSAQELFPIAAVSRNNMKILNYPVEGHAQIRSYQPFIIVLGKYFTTTHLM